MKSTLIVQQLAFFFALALSSVLSTALAEVNSCRQLVEQRIQAADHSLLQQSDFSLLSEPFSDLYGPRDQQLLWFRAGEPTPQALAVAERLSRADTKGLDTEHYDGGRWGGWLESPETAPVGPDRQCRYWLLDLGLSVSVMRYVSDLRVGRVDPKQLQHYLDTEPKKYDLSHFLLSLAESPEPERLLDRIEPPFQHYRALLVALERYRELARDPELNRPLPVTEDALRSGYSYHELGRLMYRLERLGDLAPRGMEGMGGHDGPIVEPELREGWSGIYSGVLVDAVKRFQGRHGLSQDGVIGKKTFAELNVPISRRVEQIKLTLERWRWMPDNLGYRPIVINVPEFKLYAFEDDGDGGYRQALDMDVIVGKSYPKQQTPMFRGSMRYIVFSPYWNVPHTIVKEELYEKIRSNPGYLASHNYQIVDAFRPEATVLEPTPENIERLGRGLLKLRQTPGRHNALGVAKFMFPNDHAVYLHGTPAKRLFKRERRDFSHGCIRLADPPRLAEHVLKEKEGWDRKQVDALITGGKWRQVGLDRPLDVFVLYGTAVADADGTVRFFNDIYGHDERLAQALDQAVLAPEFKGGVRWGGKYPNAVVQLTSGELGRYPGE